MIEISGKKVAVLGLGASGKAAAEACRRVGAQVVLYDARAAELEGALGDEWGRIASDLGDERLLGCELAIVSPGLPQSAGLTQLEAAGVELWSELELGARLFRGRICAVGGTNGKSTTTRLIAELVRASGRSVFEGGNLGTPLSAAGDQSVGVVEVSSFQLERVVSFRPSVSVLLNITEDHLDRHGSLDAYAATKGNAFVRQESEDTAIGPSEDPLVDAQLRRGRAKRVYYGSESVLRVAAREVRDTRDGQVYSVDNPALAGTHNCGNAAAAIAAARALGVEPSAIQRGLDAYSALPHRLQLVCRCQEVDFIDDSKATNVGAAVAAVQGLDPQKVVLIAGGKDKGGSYRPLASCLRRRARAAVLLGEATEVMAAAFNGYVRVERAKTMDDAVRLAQRLAKPGDAVLLSPACASFDMFSSYAQRGDVFARCARALAGVGEEELP